MIAERWCGTHCEPLLELRCCFQHGWTSWDSKTRRRDPNFEVEAWLVVIDGIVVAECDLDRIRWLRHPFEGGRKLGGRTDKGLGGRAWSLDMQLERRATLSEARLASRRAQTERRRIHPVPVVTADDLEA